MPTWPSAPSAPVYAAQVAPSDTRPAGREEMPFVGQGTANRRQFTGHERDDETGMDYMLARYYSSSIGRFMGSDPISPRGVEAGQAWNRFAYVANRPLSFADPSGAEPEKIGYKERIEVIAFHDYLNYLIYASFASSLNDSFQYDSEPLSPRRRHVLPWGGKCTYEDYSLNFKAPAAAGAAAAASGNMALAFALALGGITVGMQVDDTTGDSFGYLGGSFGLGYGPNPTVTISHAKLGNTGAGWFWGVQGNILGIARQAGFGNQGGKGYSEFLEKGIASELAGVSVMIAPVFELPINQGPVVSCEP